MRQFARLDFCDGPVEAPVSVRKKAKHFFGTLGVLDKLSPTTSVCPYQATVDEQRMYVTDLGVEVKFSPPEVDDSAV